MTTRYCPITGTPLPLADRKAVISRAAEEDFRYQTASSIARLIWAAQAMLTPGHTESETRGSKPASRPPLNLHALTVLIDAETILRLWAVDLVQNLWPTGTHFALNDWATIQHIYQNADLVHFEPAPDLIEEVTAQVKKLRVLTAPPTIPDLKGARLIQAREHLKESWLPLTYACAAVEAYTGTRLPESTVRTWAKKGKINRDDWGRYQVGQLINKQDHATR